MDDLRYSDLLTNVLGSDFINKEASFETYISLENLSFELKAHSKYNRKRPLSDRLNQFLN